ncbi:MAG: haloacid dehalogenase-like hydrolase [Phycisphaerales bacterium]|nr:haloacid dehalogenase-like hydrolase [Phycisphaerales bacterium]
MAIGVALCACASRPLPSWNDTPARAAIINFVEDAAAPSGSSAIPREQRIAVFDNDGTLWSEQPLYFQLLFAIDRVHALAPQRPEWKSEEPFRSILAGDTPGALAQGKPAIEKILAATHAGMTTDEFDALVRAWARTARHPSTGRLYTEMVYQPMLELLDYLESRGFNTYIVSGGGVGFMRAWASEAYGVPPERIIGSSGRTAFEVRGGRPVLVKQPEIWSIDDGPGKPANIDLHIGRRPVIAVGNSDGDFEMLEWTTSAPGPRLGVLIHHTDAQREWAYDRDSHIGALKRGLDEADARGWIIIDMSADWATVHPPR